MDGMGYSINATNISIINGLVYIKWQEISAVATWYDNVVKLPVV